MYVSVIIILKFINKVSIYIVIQNINVLKNACLCQQCFELLYLRSAYVGILCSVVICTMYIGVKIGNMWLNEYTQKKGVHKYVFRTLKYYIRSCGVLGSLES